MTIVYIEQSGASAVVAALQQAVTKVQDTTDLHQKIYAVQVEESVTWQGGTNIYEAKDHRYT